MPSTAPTRHPVPEVIEGGLHEDARGSVSFVNDFSLAEVERFYTIRAQEIGVVRGWVGHQRGHRWFAAITGEVLVAVVCPDDWESPSPELRVRKFTLSAASPQVLSVPPGLVAASVHLQAESTLMVFSSSTLEAAKEDEHRFPADMWLA